MLEHVAISRPDFDPSELAEALIYYGRVDMNVTAGHIVDVISSIGIDNTIRLSEIPQFNFIYTSSFPAVYSQSDRYYNHRFASIKILKTSEGRNLDTPEREIISNIKRRFGNLSIPRAKIERLCKSIIAMESDGKIIMDAALNDIQDDLLLSNMIRASIGVIAPSYPKTSITIAHAEVRGEEFNFHSNIDFGLLNSSYKDANPNETSPITAPNLLSNVANMRWEIYRSGDSICDIWTSALQSAVLCAKVNSFINRLTKGQKSIERFQEFTLNGRSFRAAYNSGNLDFSDILDFIQLEDTQKFKKWISESKPTADLLREYDKYNSSDSKFMKSLPFRAIRFVAFSAFGAALGNAVGTPGMVGVLTGLAADFTANKAEEMLFEKIKLGWRPNQWISEAARPALSK